MKKILLISILSLWAFNTVNAQTKVLFDASKAEMAGNADWVIDADKHDIGTGSGGIMAAGSGSESNPQRFPTPAQSTVDSTTAETYWEGSLSHWAIDLVNKGFNVETLPYNGRITYNDTSNVQDLSNYAVYIVDEPNIRFTKSEKTAILNFVKNGGGLFMISDHTGSDRNGDGWDSPSIWNDLMNNNDSVKNPFGIHYDSTNFSTTSYNVVSSSTDSCLHGPEGSVTGMQYNNGTTMTLDTSANSEVRGLIYRYSSKGLTNAMVARSRYGKGKIVACGDSSPMDDGTGDPGDKLYKSYTGTVSNSHQKLCVNGVIWLAAKNASAAQNIKSVGMDIRLYPNPVKGLLTLESDEWLYTRPDVMVKDVLGNDIKLKNAQLGRKIVINTASLPLGIYVVTIHAGGENVYKKFIVE